MNEKPTLDLDRLEIIRRLLERQEGKVDNLDSKMNLLDTRFRNVEATTESTRSEVQRLDKRMAVAEKDIRSLKEKDSEIVRQSSSADLQQEAAIAGAKAHMATIDSKLDALAKAQAENTSLTEETKESASKTSRKTHGAAIIMGVIAAITALAEAAKAWHH